MRAHRFVQSGRPRLAHRFVADRGDSHERLDRVVLRRVPAEARPSRAVVQRAIEQGFVSVDGQPVCRPAARVAGGHLIEASLPEPVLRQRPMAQPVDLVILFEDDHLLVIDKPAGLVAHPTYKHATGTLLNGLLAVAGGAGGAGGTPWTPTLVHRLDKDTSGTVLVAKHRDALLGLQRGWRDASTVKRYVAVTLGQPVPRHGRITLRVRRDPFDRRRMLASATAGDEAETRYDVIARSRGSRRRVSLIRCELSTGRLHQIRVHLAAARAPIIGDPVYGPASLAGITDTRLVAAIRAMNRQALHACRLIFRHPVTGTRIEVSAPLPSDIRALLDAADLDVESFVKAGLL